MFTTDDCDIVENKEATTDSVKWRDKGGLDEIHPILLKSCAAALTEPLSIIFHNSFKTGELTYDWKTAIIQKKAIARIHPIIGRYHSRQFPAKLWSPWSETKSQSM